jgi:phospholipase C
MTPLDADVARRMLRLSRSALAAAVLAACSPAHDADSSDAADASTDAGHEARARVQLRPTRDAGRPAPDAGRADRATGTGGEGSGGRAVRGSGGTTGRSDMSGHGDVTDDGDPGDVEDIDSGHAPDSGGDDPDSGYAPGSGGMSGSGGVSGSGGMTGGGTCPSPATQDAFAAQRAACAFTTGAMPTATLALTTAQQAAIPIEHVIVMMKENRSYDHYFGKLAQNGQADAEVQPSTFSNLDAKNSAVAPFHLTTTCLHDDPGHQWAEMHNQVHSGAMDGFVKSAASSTTSDGHFVMGYYLPSDIPFYYFLANTFALADHYFASVRSGTAPNRDYLLLATSDGVKESNAGVPRSSVPTIFDALDAKGVSWGVYSDEDPFEGCLGWTTSHAGVHAVSAFKSALANGTLPAVAYVDSKGDLEDEHPTANVQVGEAWTRDIYAAVIASPSWSSTALIFTYDEAGGFADHVPPPTTCVARPADAEFFELGARVPTVVISPWARRHYVSHVVHEHTSILRFIETVFDLPALTARDANSDALLDMFDFTCPAQLSVPAAPAAGTGGCH